MITAKMKAEIELDIKLKNTDVTVEQVKSQLKNLLLKYLHEAIGVDEETSKISLHSNINITQLDVEKQKDE